MTTTPNDMVSFGEVFKRKSVATLALGVMLMIASMYINTLKDRAGDYGLYSSIVIIIFALVILAITWYFDWSEDK